MTNFYTGLLDQHFSAFLENVSMYGLYILAVAGTDCIFGPPFGRGYHSLSNCVMDRILHSSALGLAENRNHFAVS